MATKAHKRYWQPITWGTKVGPKFLSSDAAGRWANKHFGVGNWTLQYVRGDEA